MTHKKKDLPRDLSPYDLVLIGHSHQYSETRQGSTLIVNPGSCGPRRFHQPITLARAVTENKVIAVTRIDNNALPIMICMKNKTDRGCTWNCAGSNPFLSKGLECGA